MVNSCMLIDSAPVSAAPAISKKTGRVLFALSPKEWRLFLPDGVEESAFEIFKYPEDTGSDSFSESLLRLSPDVLVTSWSTPSLPPESFEDTRTMPAYLCHTTGSVKHLIPRSFLEKGGLVTNWGTLAARGVAEHALLLTLAGLRRLPEWPDIISGKKIWQPSPVVTQTLFGKRVGLHGFGNVGQALVELLRPFGVSISAWSAGVPPEMYQKYAVTRCSGLEELMAGSDVLIECEALTPLTTGIITSEILQLLPEGALFVNVGRGLVVDEAALGALAKQGRIRVALDVYETDPIAKDSSLHEVKGAVLSPHIAGPTSDQFTKCGELVLRNLKAFFEGRPLEAVINLEIYDRST